MIDKIIEDSEFMRRDLIEMGFRGQWDKEGHYYASKISGYYCAIMRRVQTFTLCGYVRLPYDHPVLENLPSSDHIYKCSKIILDRVNEHIQYARPIDFAKWRVDQYMGLNLPGPGVSWYIGFSCAESEDLKPGMRLGMVKAGIPEYLTDDNLLNRVFNETYKNPDYVLKHLDCMIRELRTF